MHYNGPVSTYFEKITKLDDGKPINWNDYHYRDLIDLKYLKRMVLRTSRQVGKSIFNVMLCLKFAHVPMFRTIYMAPTQKQTDEFSKLKLGKILATNSELRQILLSNKSPLAVTGDMPATSIYKDVYIKTFATGASLKLGYASDEAGVEKVRGGSGDALIKDESQSMNLDMIDPILDPMLARSDYAINVNTGTPLDPDDDLCKLFDTTSQHTWVVKCHHCNKYTLFLHLKQVGRQGVLCYHCLKPVDVRAGRFIAMNPSATVFGMHCNQLMMPGVVFNPVKYADLVDKVYATNRNDNKLYAEELGVPKGYVAAFIGKPEVAKCKGYHSYSPDDYENIVRNIKVPYGFSLVAGLDWGGGANDQAGGDLPGKSHTAFVLMLIGVDQNMRVRIKPIYHKLYPLPNVKDGIDDVLHKIRLLPPGTLVAPDYMGGAYGNSTIFQIASEKAGSGIKCLPVRFLQLISLIEHKQELYRVDIDRNFIISNFIKKKVIDMQLELPINDACYNEMEDSILSMKNLTLKNQPGATIWVLRNNRTNDLMMAMIAGWVSYCVVHNLYRDIVL